MDTMKQVNNLKEVGIDRLHAEAIVENWSSVMNENFATKEDVKDLEHKIDKMELRLTIKLGAMLLGFIGILRWLQIINP